MTEEERANWLARAVDDIIHGTSPGNPSNDLDQGEIESLLRIARLRRDSGHAARQASANHEGDVWKSVIERLEQAESPRVPERNLSPDDESEAMSQLIAMRRSVSNDALSIAEGYRDEVWRRVQERIAKAERGRKATAVTEPRAEPQDLPRGAAAAAEPFTSGDPELDSLVRVALARVPVRRDPEIQARLWARVGVNQGMRIQDAFNSLGPTPVMPRLTPRLVGITAAIGSTVAILAPLPATGFGAHPALAAAEYLIERAGVVEASDAPPFPGAANVVPGMDATVAEGELLLGLPIATPTEVPDSFTLVSSRYFPTPITTSEGGVFSLVYTNADDTAFLAVHQEASSGAALVAAEGSSREVLVGDGPASYFDGSWQTADGAFTWQSSGSQTIVFDANGVRTIVKYSGPAIDAEALLAVANSVAANRAR